MLSSQPFIHTAKCCYWSWMLTLCHWSQDFLAESCLLFLLCRKPLEMFTSRALCTELWRQILVMFFDSYDFVWANTKSIIRPHLPRHKKINSESKRLWYGKKLFCLHKLNQNTPWPSPPCNPLSLSASRSLFSYFPGKYICYGEQSHAVLKKLSEHGKKMFLITNSPFDFV